MKKESKELQISNPISLMSVQQMKDQLALETKKRKILTEFINEHMKEGVDYGQISIKSKRTGVTYTSKPTLFKPGAEKFCSLFRIRAEYKKDSETWEMLGNKAGTVCYVCQLYNGEILVGEGRGVCTTEEKDSENTAVKIAKKRAKLDAVLETGGLSEFFSQDLDDEEIRVKGSSKEKPSKTDFAKKANELIDNAQNIENLMVVGERIKNSDKFTDVQKSELSKKVMAKLNELENAKN